MTQTHEPLAKRGNIEVELLEMLAKAGDLALELGFLFTRQPA
ncbi:MAG: hypothetical protein ACYC3I_19440 [Gemmataceae bacterium]